MYLMELTVVTMLRAPVVMVIAIHPQQTVTTAAESHVFMAKVLTAFKTFYASTKPTRILSIS
jgi:hypothetical protein